jgi:hypothetical protein
MKRLLGIIIGLFLIGCEDTGVAECNGCTLELSAFELQESTDGQYILEYNQDLAQTYTMLEATTECGWSQHLQWDTDYQYLINTDWVSLVNPGSMTDEGGVANVMFAAWGEFIGYNVTVYCGYTDDCGVHHLDSLKIEIVDNE